MSSSYALSSRANNNKINQQDNNEPEELLNQGVEKIYHSFNINNKIFKEKINENENIINSLTKKLEMLNNEIEMLQRENQYYKSQNENLKKEVEKLNKIVKKIQGKLTNVDFQINECIKGDSIQELNMKKQYDFNKKAKNKSLYINFKNKDNKEPLFQINSNNYLVEEKDKYNGNYNNKSTKNKKLVYYIDNNIDKDNGNKINYNKEMETETNNNENEVNNYEINTNMDKKIYKKMGSNSFDLNVKINKNNDNFYKKDDKLKTPNSVLYKNIINKEEKKKKSNQRDMIYEQPRESSLSYQENDKNRSYSSKQFLKENNIISNNKTTDEIKINNIINNNNIDKINKNVNILSTNNKDFKGKICLTYDNLFNKMNSKKNSYTSFRGKILNKNITENIFKNNDNKKNKNINFNLLEKIKNDEITYFLKKCKMLLDKEFFEEIVKLFQEYKDGLLTDEGIIIKTQRYIESNKELIELFNKVFEK